MADTPAPAPDSLIVTRVPKRPKVSIVGEVVEDPVTKKCKVVPVTKPKPVQQSLEIRIVTLPGDLSPASFNKVFKGLVNKALSVGWAFGSCAGCMEPTFGDAKRHELALCCQPCATATWQCEKCHQHFFFTRPYYASQDGYVCDRNVRDGKGCLAVRSPASSSSATASASTAAANPNDDDVRHITYVG